MNEIILPSWAQQLAVFDTETTGINTKTSRIVTAHISLITDDGSVSQGRDWLINAGVEIPERATEVHGITTERMMAEGADAATSLAEIRDELSRYFYSGIPVVAYNAAYDFSILDSELKRYGIEQDFSPRPVIDPLIIDRHLDKYRKGSRTLVDSASLYGVSLVNAHEASADAIAAGLVARALAAKFAEDLNVTADEIHEAQIVWAREQGESFAKYRASQGKPVYNEDHSWPVRQ